MYTPPPPIPMIDRGFDHFEWDNEMGMSLHEAEIAIFAHRPAE